MRVGNIIKNPINNQLFNTSPNGSQRLDVEKKIKLPDFEAWLEQIMTKLRLLSGVDFLSRNEGIEGLKHHKLDTLPKKPI